MKNRLARIFNPRDGRTEMLAIDHGYFQGPTTGLERIDISILPLVPYCDTLMCTRGILRSVIPPAMTKLMVIRASGGPSILKEHSDEQTAMDMEDCIRLGVGATAIQVFIGRSIRSGLATRVRLLRSTAGPCDPVQPSRRPPRSHTGSQSPDMGSIVCLQHIRQPHRPVSQRCREQKRLDNCFFL